MSQEEVYKFLENNKNKLFSIKEISDNTNLSYNRASANSLKLYRKKLIKKTNYNKDDIQNLLWNSTYYYME